MIGPIGRSPLGVIGTSGLSRYTPSGVRYHSDLCSCHHVHDRLSTYPVFAGCGNIAARPSRGETVTIDRRQFMSAAAVSFAAQLVSASLDAVPQTPPPPRPLPPDSGLFSGFEARWVRTP